MTSDRHTPLSLRRGRADTGFTKRNEPDTEEHKSESKSPFNFTRRIASGLAFA